MKKAPLYFLAFILGIGFIFGCRKQAQPETLDPIAKSKLAASHVRDTLRPCPCDTMPHHPGDSTWHCPCDTIPRHPGDSIPHWPGDSIPHYPGDSTPHRPDSTPHHPDSVPHWPDSSHYRRRA